MKMSWPNQYKNNVLGTCLRVFGESVTYRPSVGGSYILTGIFNEIYQSIDGATGAIVQSHQPNLGLRLSDLQFKPTSGDLVVVRGTTYRVIEAQDDGEGGSALMLHKN